MIISTPSNQPILSLLSISQSFNILINNELDNCVEKLFIRKGEGASTFASVNVGMAPFFGRGSTLAP
jgi:hypothetical protein